MNTTSSRATSTARPIVRRGARASSAIGAAASNPPKASTVKIIPTAIPPKPAWCGTFANWVLKTSAVLRLPAAMMSHIDKIMKTPNSKTLRMKLTLDEVRMPR